MLMMLMLMGCMQSNVTVVATSTPVCHLLTDLGVNHTCLMPEGISPHHWTPSYMDIQEMEHARLVFAANPILEPWAKGHVIYLFPTDKNPHTWLKPSVILNATKKICSLTHCKNPYIQLNCSPLNNLTVIELYPTLEPMADECGFRIITLAPSTDALPPTYADKCKGKCVMVPDIIPDSIKDHLRAEGCKVEEFDPLMREGFRKGFPLLVEKIRSCASR